MPPQHAQLSSTSLPTLGHGPDGQELERLRKKFLTNRWRDLDALSSAVTTNEWATIQTIGHRIKGLAGSYGFEEIGTIGAILEEAAAGKQMDRVALQIRELTQVLERLNPTHY